MNDTTDAVAIFAPLWKRKWLILIVGVLAAAATYVYYSHQPKVYGATTQIYLGGSAEVQSLLGDTQTNANSGDRTLANQAQLINSSIIGDAVQSRLRTNPAAASGSAQASAATGSDFIAISSTARTAQGAADLANAYAQAYLQQSSSTYRSEVQTALDSTRKQLQSLTGNKSPTGVESLQIQSLADRINQLHAELLVGHAGNQQIDPAFPGAALSPKPQRNALFGFVLGLALAAIAAYALSRFDRRLRLLGDVEEILQTPLLTALPSVKRPVIRINGEPAPAQPLREPLRRLHSIIQLRGMPNNDEMPSPHTILFVSAEPGDGKSTLVANLALIQREAGERVAIIESDLRRPIQAALLGVDGTLGLAEVLAGKLPLQEAIQRVEAPAAPSDGAPESASTLTAVEPRGIGSVSVLASGGAVANPQALLSSREMPSLLRSVGRDFDYVLVDAPPPLAVSDVLPLFASVDAIVIVARIGHTGETAALRLVEMLNRAPNAPVIGAVANDVPQSEIEAFGFSSAYYNQNWRRTV